MNKEIIVQSVAKMIEPVFNELVRLQEIESQFYKIWGKHLIGQTVAMIVPGVGWYLECNTYPITSVGRRKIKNKKTRCIQIDRSDERDGSDLIWTEWKDWKVVKPGEGIDF